MADGITIRAQNFRFEGKNFSKAMNRELEALFVEAARAFLIAAVRRIQIRTGFLRGAFTRLEDVVGAYQIGASKRAPTFSGHKGAGPASRPNRDLAVVSRRLARLRENQRKILIKLRTLHRREAERRAVLNRKITALEEKQKGFVHEKQLAAILRVNRDKALRERNTARFLLRQGQENEKKIDEAVRRFEARVKVSLNSKAVDERNATRLKLAEHQQRRNERFQRDLKALKRAYFGSLNKTPGKFAGRTPGTIGRDEFTRRLSKLRDEHARPTKTQDSLREKLSSQSRSNSKKLKSRLQAYKKKLQRKYADRLEEARLTGDHESITKIAEEVEKKIERAKRRIKRGLSGTKTGADRLLATLQRQAREHASMSAAALDQLQLRLEENDGRLNVVARTTRGRIVGQNVPGKFNLRGTERVKKIFNQPGGDKLQEYYYPVVGAPQARVLKTPRSGRKFATPAEFIIQKITKPQPAGLGLLKQLTGILGNTGRAIDPAIQAAVKDVADTVSFYQFNFAVDIRYLAINDVREAWFAWEAAMKAFNQVIVNGAARRLPNLSDFMLVETRRLSTTSRSIQVSGRR
jgi:hypothetical protein